MNIESYTIVVTGDETKLVVTIPVESVEDAQKVVADLAPPKKGGKAAAKPSKGKKGKKEPEPEEEEEEDEDDGDSEEEEDEDDSEDDDDEEEEDEDDSEDDDDEEEEEEAPKKGKGKKGKADAKPAGKVKVKITPELKKAEKLRTVLQVLMKQGLKTKKDLTAACLALQSKLDVLKNIQELETRVPRAIELIDPKVK